MILKYISIPELNFSESWQKGLEKIKDLSKFDRFITIFWLIGPFIYLIERDPADLWLTSICLVFLYRCAKKKEWDWAKGRLTAGAVVDLRNKKGIDKYIMFFHGSGPNRESEGDFDKNCSIGIAWSDDLVKWEWPNK